MSRQLLTSWAIEKKKKQEVDNIWYWYLAEDRRKETTESQDVEHKVTQASGAGSRSLQDKGQVSQEEHPEQQKSLC